MCLKIDRVLDAYCGGSLTEENLASFRAADLGVDALHRRFVASKEAWDAARVDEAMVSEARAEWAMAMARRRMRMDRMIEPWIGMTDDILGGMRSLQLM